MSHSQIKSRGAAIGLFAAAVTVVLAAAGTAGIASAAPVAHPHALNPKVAPGGNFDLSRWELQLPTGSTNNTTTISPAQLEGPNGYQNSKFFFTSPTDGSMTFFDPENGVTLGSKFPRTELREMDANGNLAEWALPGTHTLSATLSASKIPDHVAVGQVHNDNSVPNSKPLLELFYYGNGDIKMGIEQTPAGGNEQQFPVTNVPLNKQWTYVITLTGGNTINLTVTSGGATTTKHWPIPSSFDAQLKYFKAGDYDQSVGSSAKIGALVHFYALSFSHSS